MTTTELGINVGTGQSEEELNKLADSMDNVLAKFIKVMETAGRSEEAFQKIAGAVGVHQTKLKAMTDDVKKASMVLGPEIAKTNDMTIRGLSTNITKQFNKLSRDISAVFSLIPQELKKSTQEIANMSVAMNNNLGGIKVQAKEAVDALYALAEAEKKLTKPKSKTKEVATPTTEMWGSKYTRAQAIMEADAWDEAIKSAKKYEAEQVKIEKRSQEVAQRIASTTKAQEFRSDRKENFNVAAGVVERSEKDTIDYITTIKNKTESVARTLADARAKGYIDVEEIREVQKALTEVNKETKSLSVANKDMSGDAGRAMAELSESVNSVNKDFKELRNTSKIGFLESLGIDIPKVKELQDSLKGVSHEIQTLDADKVDLSSLTRLKKELTGIRDKSSIIGAKNEEVAAKNLLKTVEDQINAVELLNKEKDKQANNVGILNKEILLYQKVANNIDNAKNVAQKLSAQISGIDTGTPLFQDLQGIQKTFNSIEKVKSELKETIVQARKLDDPMQLNALKSQLKIVIELEEKLKNSMKGMHPTEVGGISDPTITQFKQEIELLEKIKMSLDRVTEAREKLAASKGHKGNTEEAKKELADAKADADQYYDLISKLKRDLSHLGVRDSEAVRSLQNNLGVLNKEIGSLGSQIKGTEQSFKNLWGAATMAMGKFLLYYHTAGVVIGMIRGAAQGLLSTINGMMRISEPVTNLEKALLMLNETGGGLTKTRQEMKYFKDTANQLGFAYKDLAEGYKQFKDIADRPGGNYQGVMNIWKEMTAAARATGQSGDLQDFYKGFTDAIGKGQIMTEELKKQLAQRLPGLIKGVEKEIAAFRNIDASKFNIFTAMEKGTVKLSEFMAAFENFLPKWSKLGESMGDAYSASIGRLSNAWTDLMTKIVTGPTGSKVIDMIEDMVAKLKDDDVAVVFTKAATSITNVARVLMDIAANIIPQIGRALRSLPFLDMDAKIAASNPKVTQGAIASVNKASEFDILYSSQQLGGFLSDLFGGPIKRSSQRQNLAERFSSMYQTEGIGDLFAQGWISAGASEGSLRIAKNVAETVGFEFDKRVLETSEGMSTKVFDPILNFLIAVDGDMSKLNAKIEQARQAMYAASGSADALGIEATYNKVMTSDWAKQTASGAMVPINFGSVNKTLPSVAIPKTPEVGVLGSSLVSTLLHNGVGQLPDAIKAKPKSYEGYDSAAKEDTEAESKLKAFQKGLEGIQDEINKASMGKWAYEFSQITHRLKELEIELGEKAAPQIQELGEALRKDFLKNFSKGIEDFDMSLDQKIRSGKYGKELQTSTDTILKEYRDNKQKIEEEFRDVSLIPGASEEDFAKVKQFSVKVEEARRASFENVLDEAVMTENTIAEARVAGAEATVKKIAAIRNNETKDVIDNLKTIINETDRVSGAGAERRIADIERAGEVAKKEGMDELEVFRQVERMKQAEIDKTVEHRMNNSGSFTEYLNIRLAKEQGLFDNSVVATQKQFEKMYEAVGGGAVEMGTTIEKSFTDAFTGTLKSWGDVWKEIQAIFLKTLAAMIWESKARPITISVVSALTGVTPALAGGSAQGNMAAQAHDMVTGGSQSGGGVFSTLSKGFDKFTKAVDDFGKDTLKLTGDLSDILGAGVIGAAVGGMVNGTAGAIGGGIGGAVGNAVGSAVGEAVGGTLGAMAPGIGQVIGTVAGTSLSKAFFGGTRVTDNGIKVTIDEKGLEKAFTYVKTKNDSWFGGGSKVSYSEMDSTLYRQINSQIQSSFSTISRQMLSLGLTSNFSGFSVDEKVSLKGSDPEAMLKAWLNKLAGKMVDTAMGNEALLVNFTAVKKAGETSSETLERLVTSLSALQDGAISANVSVEKLAGGLSGLDLAAYASDLADALGGTSGVSDFLDRIEKFIGYAGTSGIQNMDMLSTKFQTALGTINSFEADSTTRTSTLTNQMANLQYTKTDLENKISKFASGAGWSQWLSFDGNNLNMTGKGGFSTVEEMMNASSKWKEQLTPIVAYVEELKNTNAAITNTATKLEREATLPTTASIKAYSSTFWADYTKALNSIDGMTPELTAAWNAAATVAESIADMRDKAEEARKKIEELNATYNRQREVLGDAAKIFKASSSALWDVSVKAQGMNQNDLPAWFEESGNALVDGLIPGLSKFIREGETALDTIERLTNVFKDTNEAASLAGTSLQTLSGADGLAAANYAQSLVDYFGSQDTLDSVLSSIGNAIYDDDQLNTIAVDYWKAQATAQAEALGTTLDAAKDFLKDKMSQAVSDPALLNSYAQLATSMNNMETAAGSASDSVDSLADYLDEIRNKIKSLGMTDTESFLFDLQKEIKDMKKEILSRGGTEADTALADAYGVAAISNKLSESMDEVYASIRKLTTPDLVEQINQLSDSYWEQTQAAVLLGASQEELNAILYNSYLQAKEVLKSAAQAYVQAYDDTLSQIEDLKNKQQALEDDVNDKRNGYMASLKKEIDLKQEAIDKLQENVDKLKDFITSLEDLKVELATSAGFLSPLEKAGVTLSEFYKTANLASKGDTTAMGNISSQAQAALEAASSGSYEDYIRTFASIYSTVSDLEASAQAQLDPQQQQLDALIASRDTLQDIYKELEKLNDNTLTIDAARTAYETAQATLAASTYNAQITAAQMEADRHKNTIELLRSQYANDLTLTSAATTFFTIKKTIEEAVSDPNKLAASYSTGSSTTSTPVSESYDFSSIMEVYGRMETTANMSNATLATISTDVAITKNTQREMSNTLSQIEDYLYPEKTTDGSDKGIKVIVAATSVRDGVLLALRTANTMSSIPPTSVIGLLNSINNAGGGGVDPSCTYATDTTGTSGCSSSVVTTVTDTLGLAPVMTETIFSTVEAALVYSRQFGVQTLTEINFSFSTEDPNCSAACYFIG